MKIALKYCGGCDPDYDRVDYYQRIKTAVGDGVQWTRLDEGDHDLVLVICGCAKACVVDEIPDDKPVIMIKDDDADSEEVAAQIKKRSAASNGVSAGT